ncbi:MAG: PaaI family thioesterase [Acidimicrobiia bacterium]
MSTHEDPDLGQADEAAALTSMLRSLMPFADVLGLVGVRGVADEVVVHGEWAPERCTAGGVLHGGYLMALADSTGAACAVFNLPPDSITSTIESKTNFFRPVTEGAVTVRSSPVHVGRTTIVVQTDVTRADGALVTRTTQTQAVLPATRR